MNMTPVAQAVQRQGRGDDTMLVHMTPGEVGGLQALAMAHGGSLSINPSTGLPEAGFLKNLLPTLIGAGLMLIPGVNAVGAGLITGGIETARTGDIGKGFLAGLGAFGGANLAGGLMQQAGTSAAASAAGGAGAAGGTAGLEFARTPAEIAAATGGTAPTALAPSSLGTTVNPITFGDTGAAIYGGTPSAAMTAPRDVFGNVLGVDEMASLGGDSSRVLTAGSQAAPTFSSNAARLAEGTKNLFTQEGAFDRFIGEAATKGDAAKGVAATPATGLGGGFGAAKTIGLAAAPALMAGPEYAPPSRTEEESNYEGPYTPSERRVSYPGLDERRRTSEFMYFNPSNPVPFDKGGVPMLEDGGFVLTKKAVDGLGRGSNKKGQRVASAGLGAIPIKGAGAKRGPKAGVDDKIKTSIEGKRPALVSNGEAYVPKKQVAKRGGAKAFYALMRKAEKRA